MKQYLQSELQPALQRLTKCARTGPFSVLILLGSAAEGRPFRDLDVAYLTTAPVSDPLAFNLDWEARLEQAAEIPVDLVPLDRASIGFQHEASKGRVLHCQDPELLAEWKEKTWRTYLDLKPYFRRSPGIC